ncbi:hypothetical protein LLG96_16630 [bacterium]|nr:hypothetical protein [bacterium]
MIILYIILFFFGLLILAVFLPVKMYFRASGDSDDGFMYEIRIHGFNGLFGGGFHKLENAYQIESYVCSRCILKLDVTRKVSVLSRAVRTRIKKRKEKKEIQEKKPAAGKGRGISWYYCLARDIFSALRWVIREFHDMIGFDEVTANIRLGLGYPHITGWIIGALYAFNGILPEKYRIQPSWNFTRRVIAGDIIVRVTVRGYILWIRLMTRTPCMLYRKRERIMYWFREMKRKNSLQEV